MAQSIIQQSQLRLVFEAGVDEAGKPIYRRRQLNNIKVTASPEQLLAVSQALASLQSDPLVQVERSDLHLITNEGGMRDGKVVGATIY
ncbi:hypothetical protein GFC29_187 [Anoxybacillus sp. B7M1]|uniref:DUF1659 domain-containing protein n=1 Tax=Anoxybacteroides rupiense TaxID=311460 RepID=A0ABD5IRY4_9BACL|nr:MULTISPECIES: DUF1659 domain-containing protein [Anoxybacillus]ANB57058.1 hypothetical protein GFC28_1441 [Anoxybacillus sp. B2M1]ANB64771.1 hypothetical protein GFC29_187 [Anoxybacillus sp. B7M1]KXG10345.1 hypothetical protein AT864_00936 [Anoxybacillus sp. P3H1B]MBB3906371.1 hypothetical protein [Anoxybacillus rupiensis]MDE8564362.1 DUF1659 domain-containing protein [Anoxybacillus rupiensis]